jgi:predicted DNA-binding transcriptional regulator AlpA
VEELLREVQALRAELSEMRRFLEMTQPLELLKDTEVAAMLKIGKSSVWKRVADKRLPEPVRMGRDVRWRLADIKAVVPA